MSFCPVCCSKYFTNSRPGCLLGFSVIRFAQRVDQSRLTNRVHQRVWGLSWSNHRHTNCLAKCVFMFCYNNRSSMLLQQSAKLQTLGFSKAPTRKSRHQTNQSKDGIMLNYMQSMCILYHFVHTCRYLYIYIHICKSNIFKYIKYIQVSVFTQIEKFVKRVSRHVHPAGTRKLTL